MMTDTETVDLLMRMYAIWPNAMPPESRRATVGEEWHKLLQKTNAKRMNEALDEYAASPTGKYMPKPGELLQIYNNLLKEQQMKTSLNYDGKCPLCLGFGQVLVDAAEPFWSNYGSLGIVCPCRKSGEMQTLERGLHLTRRVKGGTLEFWLDGPRILGKLKAFQKKEPKAKAEPSRQQNLRPAFDDLPF